MNFDLTEDEQMLKAVAERFLDNQYAGEERREYQSQPCGFDPRNWALLGELGILAASYPEEAGGLDLGATSISLIHHAMGRGLAVEPLIDCALLAGGACGCYVAVGFGEPVGPSSSPGSASSSTGTKSFSK